MKTSRRILLLIAVVGVCIVAGTYWTRGTLSISAGTVAEIFARKIGPEAIDRFHHDMGRYPTTAEGLGVLLSPSSGLGSERWKGPYLEGERYPRDPWGREYRYVHPGVRNPKTYDFFSLGPDGVESGDDVGNWK